MGNYQAKAYFALLLAKPDDLAPLSKCDLSNHPHARLAAVTGPV
jgi:hypothetical protein